jgi:hypothetical protein
LQNRKGTGLQTGNNGDTANQTQSSTQMSTPVSPGNDTNIQSDNCTSDGTCTGNQTTNYNGTITNNSGSASGGTPLTLVTSCDPNCSTAPPGSLVVPAGGSAQQTTSVNVPATPPMADIEIAIDMTGSMGGAIAQAQAQAVNIVNSVQAQFPGGSAEFAVVQFKDFCTTTAPTSGPGCSFAGGSPFAGDYPEYQVMQSMTGDPTLVSNAVNGLSANGGGDFPEAYNLVFHNSYNPPNAGDIGWRSGARKFVIVIGDSQPHGDLQAQGFTNCFAIPGDVDPDGLTTTTELAGMNTSQRTLFMISANSNIDGCYQQLVSGGYSGSQAVQLGTDLSTQIVSLINAAFTTVGDVHLAVASASAGASSTWISFSPASYSNVAPGPETFTETVTVPGGTPSGTYTFDVEAVADGADIGHHTVTVFVP